MPTDSERIATLEKLVKVHLGPVTGESNIKSPHPGIIIAARDELPTASAETAYKMLILRGTDSLADVLYICLRNASQVWAWRLINDTTAVIVPGRYGGG